MLDQLKEQQKVQEQLIEKQKEIIEQLESHKRDSHDPPPDGAAADDVAVKQVKQAGADAEKSVQEETAAHVARRNVNKKKVTSRELRNDDALKQANQLPENKVVGAAKKYGQDGVVPQQPHDAVERKPVEQVAKPNAPAVADTNNIQAGNLDFDVGTF